LPWSFLIEEVARVFVVRKGVVEDAIPVVLPSRPDIMSLFVRRVIHILLFHSARMFSLFSCKNIGCCTKTQA
jgi:hypothetical protein